MTKEQLIRDFSTGAVPTGENFQSLINQTYNEGFVTSVNNTQPDANGNVNISTNNSGAEVTNENVLNAIGYTPANVNDLNSHTNNNDIHKTSEVIRNESTTSLRTEVVSSLPTENLEKGRIVFLDDTSQSFRGYNGGEWL